jgi:hypothetical protein
MGASIEGPFVDRKQVTFEAQEKERQTDPSGQGTAAPWPVLSTGRLQVIDGT